MNCRHCNSPLEHVFLDLGFAPLSNSYLSAGDLKAPEIYYPLKLFVCTNCWLVQTEDYARADQIFTQDYAYFSSVSSSWLAHAASYCAMIQKRLELGPDSLVIEIASNDGYLLKNFVSAGIPCLGIEPAASTAEAAERLGIPVLRQFFGKTVADQLAAEGRRADLVCGNNVFAHVPDINDFTAGLKAVLKPGGTITLEFPHLMRLIEQTQFDTVYHEHFSYFSLHTVDRIFASGGLRVWDVEELDTHGGSLRVYGCHAEAQRVGSSAVATLLEEEERRGLRRLSVYRNFQPLAEQIRDDLLVFLIEQKCAGKSVVAYGAAAKGNTLLNFASVKPDLLAFVCDAAPSKQGKFMPGSHIPILAPETLKTCKADYVLILPWNLVREITTQLSAVRERGSRFVIAVPKLEIA